MSNPVQVSWPIQFVRQYAKAIDPDTVFSTTAARIAYLSSPRRYPGQPAVDLEQNVIYYLNAARDTWIEVWSTTNFNPSLKADLVSGKVPSSQLPSYVDDVIEVATYAELPITGESGKIYVVTSDSDSTKNGIYRWATTVYVKVSGAEERFVSDFIVSLSGGKNYLRWSNGETVPAAGLTPTQLLLLGASEPIAPTVNISANMLVKNYNDINFNETISYSYVINSAGATLTNAKLERSRNNSTWTTLFNVSSLTTPGTYNDNGLNPSIDNRPIFYRLTITDSAGAIAVNNSIVTFLTYMAPTVGSLSSNGSGASRERGDKNSTITGTIYRNSPNIALTSYQVEYQVNGAGGWTGIGSPTSISGSSVSISVIHNDSALVDSDTLTYRIKVIDAEGTSYIGSTTVTFIYKSFLGYSSNTVLTISQLLALGSGALTNGKSRTFTSVTAGSGLYTYYTYAAGAGDLTSVVQNGADAVLTAFTKLADVTGTNSFGATITMRVYKSGDPASFTDATLAFN